MTDWGWAGVLMRAVSGPQQGNTKGTIPLFQKQHKIAPTRVFHSGKVYYKIMALT